jgi:protein Tex
MQKIVDRIAQEINCRAHQAQSAIALLDEGATVPFIARYRKEATGGLDDTQLRTLQERLGYLRELEERRGAILRSIEEQNKLTPELRTAIENADTKVLLEDLYLPYKPKRRTKAQIAREAGLEPLAQALLDDPTQQPEALAQGFLNPEFKIDSAQAALDGARQILMERWAEDAALVGALREYLWQHGTMVATVVADKKDAAAKFADYFDYREALAKIPSHRALALFRGRNEGVLNVEITLDVSDDPSTLNPAEGRIAHHAGLQHQGRAADAWLQQTVRWTWKVKLLPHLDTELKAQIREAAERDAIHVFAKNLKDLLLAAPAGHRVTLGLDPGLRTGVKVAVIDRTGKLLETTTIYPHVPQNQWQASLATLEKMVHHHHVDLISVGNGTASRETDKLAAELIQRTAPRPLTKVTVSEAGASVYSASELAAKEFPQLDVSLRGAVSIARRLQDPLAELVKIDPKSIGVGQYQHDVNQTMLQRSLDGVVEDCVNAVGVDVNTASPALLARVAGLNNTLAHNIVTFRDEHGAFQQRAQLKKVPRLGPKAFEQAAGFLRIPGGSNPLDNSAVHPEAYPVVERILKACGRRLDQMLGDSAFLKSLRPHEYVDEHFGLPTVADILRELEKPGRDPRPEFKTAQFREGIESPADLKPGMTLEGVVTNVTNFGAFVDIGVHQDGLVHISALANRFVKDPRDVVKAGDIVKVKVVEVDLKRQRIGLTMRLEEAIAPAATAPRTTASPTAKPRANNTSPVASSSAFADAFARAQKRN